MKKIKLILTIIIFANTVIYSQSSIDKILESVKSNNKKLEAYNQYTKTKKISAHTGIYLDNPEIEYVHKFGNAENGDLQEFSITQSFDFPTVYFSQKKHSNLISKQIDMKYKSVELNILLKAKTICLELIYLNKRKKILKTRLNNSKNILSMLERKRSLGSSNILEVNKAKIQMLNMQTEHDLTSVKLEKFRKQLNVINGNKEIIFTNSIYEPLANEVFLDSIKNKYLLIDPELKAYQLNTQIAETQKKIITGKNLPSFNIGLVSEISDNENFRGVLFGMSIPLWKNKNTVKYAKSNVLSTNTEYENFTFYGNSEIEQIFADYKKYKELYKLSNSVISEIESERLLKLALEQGEISALKYFSEIMFFYQTIDNLLIIEKELNIAYAKMMKYDLIRF